MNSSPKSTVNIAAYSHEFAPKHDRALTDQLIENKIYHSFVANHHICYFSYDAVTCFLDMYLSYKSPAARSIFCVFFILHIFLLH